MQVTSTFKNNFLSLWFLVSFYHLSASFSVNGSAPCSMASTLPVDHSVPSRGHIWMSKDRKIEEEIGGEKVKGKMWELLLVGNMGQSCHYMGSKMPQHATPLQSAHICTHDHSGPIHRSQRGAQKGESCRSLCFFKHPTFRDTHRKINPHSKNFFHLLDDVSVLNLLFQN